MASLNENDGVQTDNNDEQPTTTTTQPQPHQVPLSSSPVDSIEEIEPEGEEVNSELSAKASPSGLAQERPQQPPVSEPKSSAEPRLQEGPQSESQNSDQDARTLNLSETIFPDGSTADVPTAKAFNFSDVNQFSNPSTSAFFGTAQDGYVYGPAESLGPPRSTNMNDQTNTTRGRAIPPHVSKPTMPVQHPPVPKPPVQAAPVSTMTADQLQNLSGMAATTTQLQSQLESFQQKLHDLESEKEKLRTDNDLQQRQLLELNKERLKDRKDQMDMMDNLRDRQDDAKKDTTAHKDSYNKDKQNYAYFVSKFARNFPMFDARKSETEVRGWED